MDIRFVLARTWYVLVGVVAAFAATGTAIGALASGCRVAFRQEDMGLSDPLAGGCVQFVDPLVVAAAALVAVGSIGAAAWVLSPGGVRRVIARLGILAGLLGSFAPLGLAASLAAYYELGPMDTALTAIPALLPVAVGVAAALVMWRRGLATSPGTETTAVSAQRA